MRTYTLLSILIASYLASPVVHHENNLARRASNREQDLVDADIDADVDADGKVQHHDHHHYGLLDSLSLGGLVKYILHLLGLYSYYDFEDNYELLGFLVNKGDINKKQASRVEGIDILGLFRTGHGYGLLGNLINLDAGALSDQDIVDRKREMTEESDDTVSAGVTLLDRDGDETQVDTDADVDADIDADADVDVDADVDI